MGRKDLLNANSIFFLFAAKGLLRTHESGFYNSVLRAFELIDL